MRLRTVIVIGVALRLLIAPFFAHPADVYGAFQLSGGLLDGARPISDFMLPYFYSFLLYAAPARLAYNFLSNYLPNYTFPITSLNPVLNPGAPWNVTVVPGIMFDLLLKLPLIASDTMIAYLIYRIALMVKADKRLAAGASALWSLNPLVIWISSGWGTFDTLPTLFTVMVLFYYLRKKFALAGLSLVVAIALKYYAVVLILPFLILIWKSERKIDVAKAAAVIMVGCGLFFLPFAEKVTAGFAHYISGSTPAGLSYSGLSVWSALTLYYPSTDLSLVSSFVLSVMLLSFYAGISIRKGQPSVVETAVYFALPIVFLLLTYRFIAENFFDWLFPFIAILIGTFPKLRPAYLASTSIAFLSSVTDSLLPFYLLPMAPWIGQFLADSLMVVSPYRVMQNGIITQGLTLGKLYLSTMGVLAAAALVITAIQLYAVMRSDSKDVGTYE